MILPPRVTSRQLCATGLLKLMFGKIRDAIDGLCSCGNQYVIEMKPSEDREFSMILDQEVGKRWLEPKHRVHQLETPGGLTCTSKEIEKELHSFYQQLFSAHAYDPPLPGCAYGPWPVDQWIEINASNVANALDKAKSKKCGDQFRLMLG